MRNNEKIMKVKKLIGKGKRIRKLGNHLATKLVERLIDKIVNHLYPQQAVTEHTKQLDVKYDIRISNHEGVGEYKYRVVKMNLKLRDQ